MRLVHVADLPSEPLNSSCTRAYSGALLRRQDSHTMTSVVNRMFVCGYMVTLMSCMPSKGWQGVVAPTYQVP
jgi:hypothetical protein